MDRLDTGLELERGLSTVYPQDHSSMEPRSKSDFFRDDSEPLSAFSHVSEEVPSLLQPDRTPVISSFEPETATLSGGEEVESIGQAVLKRTISQGSSHSLKLEEPRFDAVSMTQKTLDLPSATERLEDSCRKEPFGPGPAINSRATPPAAAESMHKADKLPLQSSNKQKAELRWGSRGSGAGRRDGAGGDRPVRRSGPIKKPVLRDMKEEREQRREKEERHERGERSKKEGSSNKTHFSAAAAVSDGQKLSSENQKENMAEPEGGLQATGVVKSREPQVQASTATANSQEEKPSKPPPSEKRSEPKLPSRKETNLPPRAYRREERERERERERDREAERDNDWPSDANFKGRGRGEYYSRGRSYRGSYSGRGRASRGRSRGEFPYREPRSRSDLLTTAGGTGFRCREESETRSESSDFEVLPKRRRRRGSDTDSESEGRESASDTGASDREPSAKPSRPVRRELPDSRSSAKTASGFGPGHIPDKSGSRGEEDSRPKPGFLPKGEPSRRGRGGLYSRRGGGRERGAPRSGPLRRAGARDSLPWPSKPMETFRPEEADMARLAGAPAEQRLPKYEGKKARETGQNTRERPRRPRPARPPRQDKPPRFRRLKEREAAVISGEAPHTTAETLVDPSPASVSPVLSKAPGTPVTLPESAAIASPAPISAVPTPPELPVTETVLHETGATRVLAAGSKSPDLSNQNSSDQANEEWETASESSDFNERREREERKGALEAAVAATASSQPPQPVGSQSKSPNEGGVTPKRDVVPTVKRSFSSQRPVDRQNRRGNSGAKSGRGYAGGKGERRGGSGAKSGRRG